MGVNETHTNIVHETGTLSSHDGLSLFTQSWLPASALRAAVALVHGVGEHSGRYPHLVETLVQAGFAVHGYDHRGHGRSPGPRVHIDAWAQYREDLTAHLAAIRGRHGDAVPVFVYGHSMGSLVVLDHVLSVEPDVAGVVISGIATRPVGVGSPVQVALARMLTGIVPRLGIDLGISADQLSRDPQAQAATRADALMYPKATVRWGTETLDTVARIERRQADVDLPLLVVHGGADPLNCPSGAQALHDEASSTDKTLRIYPGALHEPHNDEGRDKVARDIAEWLEERS